LPSTSEARSLDLDLDPDSHLDLVHLDPDFVAG